MSCYYKETVHLKISCCAQMVKPVAKEISQAHYEG